MACVVTSDGAVYTVHYSAASGVRVSEGPILGEAIQSASHGGRAGVYYLTTAAPQSLKLCCGSTKTSVTELPMPCVKLVSYRHKLYGLGRDGCHLLIYDPLCAMTEVIDLSTPMANFEPADHGFVFTTAEGRVWGYHFNHGLSSFVAAASPATLVGYHRSAALVRLPDGTISAASETAALTALPSLAALPSTANAFVGVDDDGTIAAVSGATVHVLTKSGVVTQSLPITNTTSALCVCPIPSEEAAEDEEEPTCALCLCEFDGGDGLVLDCGHQLHADCVRMWVQKWLDFKAKAEHIVFTHAVCPAGCRRLVRHPQVEESVPVGKLHATVRAAKMEVLERLANPSKTEDDLLFYLCHRCEAPYFGGDKVCPRMMGGEPAKAPSDLLCEKCRNDFSCPDHQREWVVYKCRYCCNPATHMCFGSRYLCERCEGRWANTEPECIPCPGAATCPLGGNHSEKGSYPVGCLLTLPSTGNGLNWDKVVAPEPSP